MPATRRSTRSTPVKEEANDEETKPRTPSKAQSSPSAKSSQLKKKLKQLETFQKTPFPDYARPTPEDCQAVCDALATMHHLPVKPAKVEKLDNVGANCGLVPDPLDALIRTVLSQNTSSSNSTAARKSIEATFGEGPDYENVRKGSEDQLREAIKCGGLANVKAKVIKKILDAVYEQEGKLSLDRLHALSDEDAMRELVSFDGVGPKTASCVLLFCMGRESFAVDTHVFRITKALNWVPVSANRETTFQHLDVRIPGALKLPLHAMFVSHGKKCRNCAANSSPTKEQKAACPLVPFLSKRPIKALETDGSPSKAKIHEAEEEMHGVDITPSKRKKAPKKEEESASEEPVPKKKTRRTRKVKKEEKEEELSDASGLSDVD